MHLKGETAFQRTRAALEIKPPQNATGREAGTLKGAAQSPFYKPGERYSPPAAHRSSARSAFPPTHSEGVHGDHGDPSLPPPQGARKAAPSAGRDRRRASVRGRTARPPPTPQPLPAPRHVTESASVARQGARAPARGACAAPPPSGAVPASSGVSPLCDGAMAVFHDEVEIEDFEYDEETETYSYPCPCGDRFLITRVTAGGGEGEAVLGRGRVGRCVTVCRGLL